MRSSYFHTLSLHVACPSFIAVLGGAISNAPHPWTSGVDHGIRRVLCQWTLVRFLCSRLRNSQTCCHGLWISRSLARKFTCPPRLACCRCIFGHGGVLVGASYVFCLSYRPGAGSDTIAFSSRQHCMDKHANRLGARRL